MTILLTVFFLLLAVAAGLNIDIVIYGFEIERRLTSLIHTGIGVEVALEEPPPPNATVVPSFRRVMIGGAAANLTSCDDVERNLHLVDRYYYERKWDANNVMMMFTPGCGDSLPLGALAREWNVFMLSTGTMLSETRDRTLFPTFITLSPIQISMLTETLLAVMRRFGWTSLGVIYDKATLASYGQAVNALRDQIHDEFTEMRVGSVPFNSTEPLTPHKMLRLVRTYSRIILLSMHPNEVRKFMIAADELGFIRSKEFVFVTTEAIPSYQNGVLEWRKGDEYDEIAFRAYQQLLQITPCQLSSLGSQKYLTKLYNRSAEQYHVVYEKIDEKPGAVTVAAYQGLLMVQQVIQETLRSGKNLTDAAGFAARFLNRTFLLSDDPITIDASGQRRNSHCVKDLDISTKNFKFVLRYSAEFRNITLFANAPIDWGTPDGSAPLNEPHCGYISDCLTAGRPSDSKTTTIAVCVATAAAILTSLVCWRMIREIQLMSEVWVIQKPMLKKLIPESHKLVNPASQASNINDFNASGPVNVSTQSRQMDDLFLYHDTKVDVYEVFLHEHLGKLLKNRAKRVIFLEMRKFNHPNVCRFIGVAIDKHTLRLVSEHCGRGTLRTILNSNSACIDWEMRTSFLHDVVEGIQAIHASFFKYHGSIGAATCKLDSRFTVKISELAFSHLLHDLTISHSTTMPTYDFGSITPKADIAAFGELISEVIQDVENDPANQPHIQVLQKLAFDCTASEADERPTIGEVRHRFRAGIPVNFEGIILNIWARTHAHAVQLENLVQERTAALLREQLVCDALLREMLPACVVDCLARGIEIEPESYTSATVFFSDLDGFASFVWRSSPLQVMTFLNGVFFRFDQIIQAFDVFKVETISDSYMVVSGVPTRNQDRHAGEICAMAIEFYRTFREMEDNQMQFTAGIHSGPCVAGVVGRKRPRYCLFGDTVNVASRMASHSLPSRIHLSVYTVDLLQDSARFSFVKRGLTNLKGRGNMLSYWLMPVVADKAD